MGLENPDDAKLKALIHSAIQRKSRIHGYIEEDEKALHGYQMKLVVAAVFPGDPDFNPTEADILQAMYYASKSRE